MAFFLDLLKRLLNWESDVHPPDYHDSSQNRNYNSASSYNSHPPTPKLQKPISSSNQVQSSYDYQPSTSKPLKPAFSSYEHPLSSSYQKVARSQTPPETSKTTQTWPGPQNSPTEPSPSPFKVSQTSTFRPILKVGVASDHTSLKPSKTAQASASQTGHSPGFSSHKLSPYSIQVSKALSSALNSAKPATSSSEQPQSNKPIQSSLTPSPQNLPAFRPPLLEVASSHTPPKTSKTTQSSASQTGPNLGFSLPKPSPSSIWVSKPSSQTSFNEPPSPYSSSSSSQKFPTFKPTLREAPANSKDHEGNENYIWIEKGSLPLYMIPENMKNLIKNGIVPDVLKKPLSPVTYKDYFAALLYAEEYYFEKWSDFEMKNVTLEIKKAAVTKRHKNHKNISNGSDEPDDKIFVQFEIDSIPENRPFLLSRDLVYARPSDSSRVEPFQGVIYRVEGRENIVLVEFKEDFLFQRDFTQKYDISFSFNRVCLKRAHQALNAVSDNVIQNFLFPDFQSRITPVSVFDKYDCDISSTVSRILSIQGSPPYLIAGPLCVPEGKRYSQITEPSKTGKVVCEAVVRIYKSSPECRILISAPSNSACDVLMRSLKKVIPESDMFRANAAFRGILEVPEDILSSCLYEEECFACPSLNELRRFRVIFSTFMSSYRLHNEGLHAGHFSHVFLVDASSAIEPEALVTLAHFSDTGTTVVVTGRLGNSSSWIRSEIGRRRGLRTSYFERLRQCTPYKTLNPHFCTDLGFA